jgi:hypothetical protein
VSDPLTIAAISIGQSPRPDLVRPLRDRLAHSPVDILEIGALDRLTAADLPAPADGGYPLATRLRDGSPVTVDEAFLAPRVQASIDEAEERGAVASLLLCAGGFAGLRAGRPLVRPFEVATAGLRSMAIERILVIVPLTGQLAPAASKWASAGFAPTVRAARLAEVPAIAATVESAAGAVIVLDYVGHAPDAVRQLRRLVDRPVLDLGDHAAATFASMVRGAPAGRSMAQDPVLG